MEYYVKDLDVPMRETGKGVRRCAGELRFFLAPSGGTRTGSLEDALRGLQPFSASALRENRLAGPSGCLSKSLSQWPPFVVMSPSGAALCPAVCGERGRTYSLRKPGRQAVPPSTG